MRTRLLILTVLLVLPGCYTGKNLTPDQLDAIGRLAQIQNVSGCAIGGIEGASPMVAGEGRIAVCWGTAQPLTVDEVVQLQQGISITVSP